MIHHFLPNNKHDEDYLNNDADNDDIIFTTKDVEVSLYYNMLLGVYFLHRDDPSGIDEVKTDNERSVCYDITAQRIRISGLQNGENVSLFNLEGGALASVKADANGMVDIGLSGMSGMVYVVKVGGKSFKVTIK